MLLVNDVKLTATAAFRLGVVGSRVAGRFADLLAERDLKTKHAGLLAVLDSMTAGGAASQLDVAKLMGVAPSLVVALADHLESLGAVSRERDPADRRRQLLALTPAGRALLEECAALANGVDEDLLAHLPRKDRDTFLRVLARLAAAEGLPA
ncbi:MarR family winged helix-turn-helix transcriptional regulator [Nonomuraea sp. NBC_01738]|uniref:MarR family winged helix-turn-helix transcriptional regulator n=1 Tax=Nonomuraea sp. NBC_01738 TaxID=2976003 RepID=UPI002E124CF0|nr:MarR family winged helix-turn-helix transcriptional regulator [Nonomuraea sp. NBC_01738]